MGLDVTSHVCLGFRVEKSDFVTEVRADYRVCENGHRAPGDAAKFCSECGAPFQGATLRRPTPRLVAYARHVGRDPVDLWEEWWPEDSWCPDEPDDGLLGLHDVRELQTGEDGWDGRDEPVVVMGVRLTGTVSHRRAERGGVAGVPLRDFEDALEGVRALAKLLTMEDRPVGLYVYTFASF